MRLVHNFPQSMPVDWPENWQEHTYIIEDGNDNELYVDYQDQHFVRPMAPWKADDLRVRYQSQADYLGKLIIERNPNMDEHTIQRLRRFIAAMQVEIVSSTQAWNLPQAEEGIISFPVLTAGGWVHISFQQTFTQGSEQGEALFDLESYQEAVKRTCATTEDADTLKLALIGLSDELGEIAGPIKKYLWHGHPLDCSHIHDEVGDILWYLATLCNTLGLSLSSALHANIKKLHRRYPDGFSSESSLNRSV